MTYHRLNQYSRINAVNYAKQYALKPNPYYKYFSLDNTGGDCSNFLSQCLLAGGATMNSTWWYKHNNPANLADDTWSIPWTVAHSLYWYLKKGGKGQEVANAHMLELGDLIFFEDSPGHIFHSAIVTAFSNTGVLISQHSYEALNIPYQNTWPSIKLHFLKISL